MSRGCRTRQDFVARCRRVAGFVRVTVEEAGVLIYEVCQALINSYPKSVLCLISHMDFSERYQRDLQKRAVESHQHQYPGDYVLNFVKGDGKEFDFGIDYTE